MTLVGLGLCYFLRCKVRLFVILAVFLEKPTVVKVSAPTRGAVLLANIEVRYEQRKRQMQVLVVNGISFKIDL